MRQLLRNFHGKRSAFSRRVSAPRVFSARERCASKIRSHQLRNRSGSKERAGVVPAFRSSAMSVSPDQAFKKQINQAERRPTLVTTRCILPCGAPPFGARTLDGAPLRLSSRRVSHPQGSASGQASWTRVRTGRHLSSPVPVQCAPPGPAMFAGRLMPKAARVRIVTPPAGTALAPQALRVYLPRGVLQ